VKIPQINRIAKALIPKATDPATDFSKNFLLVIFFPIRAARQFETAKMLKAQIAIIFGQRVKTNNAAIAM
jgi:hypothetical protein